MLRKVRLTLLLPYRNYFYSARSQIVLVLFLIFLLLPYIYYNYNRKTKNIYTNSSNYRNLSIRLDSSTSKDFYYQQQQTKQPLHQLKTIDDYHLSLNERQSVIKSGFNSLLSDRLPLNRSLPDVRHSSCKTKTYLSKLPSVSIVIVYHNELKSVMLRSLYSLIERTPDYLLHEIILVDDYSDSSFDIENYLANDLMRKVKVFHLKDRQGLIKARLNGARLAQAKVLVFLDAHIEANENWLPPLLEPLKKNHETCTTPIIDIIKYDSFEYQASTASRGGFNWHFNYVQLPLLAEELERMPEPHNNPVMNGGLFAIRREYFWHLNGYDEGLEIWGGEQFELSFKIWLCGGRLLEVPCSRVAHLYKAPNYRVKYTDRKDDFISKNYKRVAEVWLDEYKDYLYEHIPKLTGIYAGNLTSLKLKRKNLNCKNFKWFLETIAPDLLKIYPPITPIDFAEGAIQSLALPNLCLDAGKTSERQQLTEALQTCSPDLKYPYASQRWHLSFRRDLRHRGLCLEVQKWSVNAPVWLWPCHHQQGNQFWFYDEQSKMIIQAQQQRCLEVNTKLFEVVVNYCNVSKPSMQWNFGYVNHTAMQTFFNDI
uniref:Polypeptide N-acetylgalactosaminyltransferase n=1 Tax=Glossina brevipalpis TaxID=37001 RepID=A0A1A9X1Y8_9MUSC